MINMKRSVIFFSTITLSLICSLPSLFAQSGSELWKKHQCHTCHGDTGKGDGVVGKGLPPGTVANLTTGKFKFATDLNKFKELLKKGGMGVKLNPLMPPAPGVKEAEAEALYKFIQSLSKK